MRVHCWRGGVLLIQNLKSKFWIRRTRRLNRSWRIAPGNFVQQSLSRLQSFESQVEADGHEFFMIMALGKERDLPKMPRARDLLELFPDAALCWLPVATLCWRQSKCFDLKTFKPKIKKNNLESTFHFKWWSPGFLLGASVWKNLNLVSFRFTFAVTSESALEH